MLQIVRGEPSDEEVAALIAVLAGLAGAGARAPAPRSGWADPAHRLRTPLHAGRGAPQFGKLRLVPGVIGYPRTSSW